MSYQLCPLKVVINTQENDENEDGFTRQVFALTEDFSKFSINGNNPNVPNKNFPLPLNSKVSPTLKDATTEVEQHLPNSVSTQTPPADYTEYAEYIEQQYNTSGTKQLPPLGLTSQDGSGSINQSYSAPLKLTVSQNGSSSIPSQTILRPITKKALPQMANFSFPSETVSLLNQHSVPPQIGNYSFQSQQVSQSVPQMVPLQFFNPSIPSQTVSLRPQMVPLQFINPSVPSQTVSSRPQMVPFQYIYTSVPSQRPPLPRPLKAPLGNGFNSFTQSKLTSTTTTTSSNSQFVGSQIVPESRPMFEYPVSMNSNVHSQTAPQTSIMNYEQSEKTTFPLTDPVQSVESSSQTQADSLGLFEVQSQGKSNASVQTQITPSTQSIMTSQFINVSQPQTSLQHLPQTSLPKPQEMSPNSSNASVAPQSANSPKPLMTRPTASIGPQESACRLPRTSALIPPETSVENLMKIRGKKKVRQLSQPPPEPKTHMAETRRKRLNLLHSNEIKEMFQKLEEWVSYGTLTSRFREYVSENRDKCFCNREENTVMCKLCGHLEKGNMHIQCPIHQDFPVKLEHLRVCPKCSCVALDEIIF